VKITGKIDRAEPVVLHGELRIRGCVVEHASMSPGSTIYTSPIYFVSRTPSGGRLVVTATGSMYEVEWK
jgi:hypothetical protein